MHYDDAAGTMLANRCFLYRYLWRAFAAEPDDALLDIVADAQIIEKLADRTVFVVRSGLLDRSMLPELENIYQEKRFKNLSVILNGTESAGGRYGYRYGYRNGYSSYYGNKGKMGGG